MTSDPIVGQKEVNMKLGKEDAIWSRPTFYKEEFQSLRSYLREVVMWARNSPGSNSLGSAVDLRVRPGPDPQSRQYS